MNKILSGKNSEDENNPYDLPPILYDLRGYFILRLSYRSKLNPLLRFFSDHIGKNHLEAAIGSGTFFELVLNTMKKRKLPLPTHIEGFDYSHTMLAGAIKRFKSMPNVNLEFASVCKLSYPDNTFDTCCCANAIHCFSDVDGALKELYRVIKPGGSMTANILLFPRGSSFSRWISNKINQWGMRKGILHTPLKLEDIQQSIKNAGFEIKTSEVVGNMYNVVAIKR